MNVYQEKAARSLRLALGKVRDANLRLLVYDGAVFVCPVDVDVQKDGGSNAFDILSEHGQDVSPRGLQADGGAGV